MAENPIDIKKLFNFDDTTPLDQVIVKIQQLNVFYDALVASAQKGAASVTSSMQVMQKSIDALEQEMVQADVTTKKGQETISNGAAVTSKAVAQNEEYKKSIADLNATIKALQDQIDKLSESNKKLPKDAETQANSLNDLKAKLKDAADSWAKMGDATDAAIKQKALKNVTDLSKAVIDGQKAINDAKKATDIAAGSYNELALKVANATKQLKAMEGGVGSNSDQFKALQKTVNDGNTKLKEFDAALGVSVRNVGDYKGQIEQLLPAIGSISPQIAGAYTSVESFGNLLKTFAGSTLSVFLAGLAVAGFGIAQYFKRTAEGEQELMEATSAFGALWEQTLNGATKIAKYFFENSTKNFVDTATLFSGQAERAKELEKELYELNQKRIEGTKTRSTLELGANQLLLEARESLTKSEQQRYDDAVLGDKILQGLNQRAIARAQKQAEIENAILINKKGGEQNLTQAEQKEIADRLAAVKQQEAEYYASAKRRVTFINNLGINIQKQRDEEQARQISDKIKLDSAIIQQDVDTNNKILQNLYSTEEERKNAIQRNFQDERALAQKARDLALQDAIKQSQDRSRQKISVGAFADLSEQSKADLLAKDKSFQLEKQKIDQDFANQSIALANNRDKALLENSNKFTKQRIDNEALLVVSTKDADTAWLNGLIETNNKILANEDSTYSERSSALKSNAALQISIAQNTLDKEIANAKAVSQNKILADNLISIHTKELAIQTDKLQDEYANKVKKINQDLIVATRTNVFITLARDLTNLNNKVKIATEEQLSDLDDQLKTSNVSITEYHAKRAVIVKNAYVKEAENQITNLESQKAKVIAEGVDTQTKLTAIEAQQSALRQGISDHENAQYIAQKEKMYQQEKQLMNSALDAFVTITNNETVSKVQALEDQLTALQASHDQQIILAGDNALAKAQIDKNFADQQAKIQKQERKLKHDQAVSDKELGEAKIIINTAIAISETIAEGGYFAIPLSIIVGALGALELAKVASTPIPAYFTGVEYSKEGLAHVAERGRELGIDPSGDIMLYDKPQIAYLNEGTKILNNAKTEPILEKMGTKHMDLVSHQLIDIGIRDLKAGQAVNVEILGKLDRLNDTTKRNKPVEINLARVGAVLYEYKKEEENYVKRTKALSFGSWMP